MVIALKYDDCYFEIDTSLSASVTSIFTHDSTKHIIDDCEWHMFPEKDIIVGWFYDVYSDAPWQQKIEQWYILRYRYIYNQDFVNKTERNVFS